MIVLEATWLVMLCAEVVKTNLLAAAAAIVSTWVAEVRPVAAMVIVGVPATVSS